MTIGERLKELREKKQITQIELGKILNVSDSNVSKYEKNQLEPSIEYIKKACDYFDVTTDFLLGRTNNPNALIREDLPEQLIRAGIKKVIVEKDQKNHEFSEEEIEMLIETYLKMKKANKLD